MKNNKECEPYGVTWRNQGTDEFSFFAYSPVIHDGLAQASYIEQGDMRIYINTPQGVLMAPTEGCKKLMECLRELFAACNTYKAPEGAKKLTLSLPIKEYMALCGEKCLEDKSGSPESKKAIKEATDYYRKKMKSILQEISGMSIEWSNKKTGEKSRFGRCVIIQGFEHRNSTFYITLGEKYANSLVDGFIAWTNHEIYKLDERNPHLQALNAKLTQYASINRAEKKHRISLASLLNACRAIPSEEEVSKTDRHYTRRIIEPFEKAMDSLSFISWKYCNAKGKPLTQKQLSKAGWPGYKDCMIEYELIGAPVEKKEKKPARKTTRKATPRKSKKKPSE